MVGVDQLEADSKKDPDSYSYLFKIVLIGAESVGKSSALLRFVDDAFNSKYMATIGVDFKTKTVRTTDDRAVKLQVWDTAGQERYRVITNAYYRGAHGAMLLFDITNESSFNHIKEQYQQIKEKTVADCKIVLVGSKSDLDDKREVSIDQAEEFANDHDLSYLEISAKSGENVSDAFETLVMQMLGGKSFSTMSTMPKAIVKRKEVKPSPKDGASSEKPGKITIDIGPPQPNHGTRSKSKLCAIL